MPTARKNQMAAETVGDYESRSADLGDYTTSFESIPAGDVYYIRPGHHAECLEEFEAVDFIPTAQLR